MEQTTSTYEQADKAELAPVFNNREGLEKILNQLGESVGVLQNRLTPLLRMSQQSKTGKSGLLGCADTLSEVSPSSPLTRQLASLQSQAIQINSNVRDILDRLDV